MLTSTTDTWNLARALFVCISMTLVGSIAQAKPINDRYKNLLKSEDYTFTLRAAPPYRTDAKLEICDGNGHGGTLNWIYFQPSKQGMSVLSIQFQEDWRTHNSKWPPDTATVVIEQARMKLEDYRILLRALAVIKTAQLKPIDRKEPEQRIPFKTTKGFSVYVLKPQPPRRFWISYNNFWVYVCLTENKKRPIDLNWAGYPGSNDEIVYAKPLAIDRLVREAIEKLNFKEHALTEGDRAWASAKFVRDWKQFKDKPFHWWVRERYIILIGLIGNATVLPTLKDILSRDPNDKYIYYYAINAITRLTKKDLRDKPVEEMDVEQTRRRILNLLKE